MFEMLLCKYFRHSSWTWKDWDLDWGKFYFESREEGLIEWKKMVCCCEAVISKTCLEFVTHVRCILFELQLFYILAEEFTNKPYSFPKYENEVHRYKQKDEKVQHSSNWTKDFSFLWLQTDSGPVVLIFCVVFEWYPKWLLFKMFVTCEQIRAYHRTNKETFEELEIEAGQLKAKDNI